MAKLQKLKPAKVDVKTPPVKPPKSSVVDTNLTLKYNLSIEDAAGTPVEVKGEIPITGGLVPAFLADTGRTIEEMTNLLIQNRFLLQARHYINQKRQEALPPPPEVEHDVSTRLLTSGTSNPSGFEYEQEQDE